MANITTVTIPATAEHTLVFTEQERLTLLASLRYKHKSIGGSDKIGALIRVLESVNDG